MFLCNGCSLHSSYQRTANDGKKQSNLIGSNGDTFALSLLVDKRGFHAEVWPFGLQSKCRTCLLNHTLSRSARMTELGPLCHVLSSFPASTAQGQETFSRICLPEIDHVALEAGATTAGFVASR